MLGKLPGERIDRLEMSFSDLNARLVALEKCMIFLHGTTNIDYHKEYCEAMQEYTVKTTLDALKHLNSDEKLPKVEALGDELRAKLAEIQKKYNIGQNEE